MGEGEIEGDFGNLGDREDFQQGLKCADIVRQLICHFIPQVSPAATPHRDRECDLRVQQFIAYDRQVEGWFKGEIMLLLNQMQKEQIIEWWPEVSYDWDETRRRKCDFVLRLNDTAQTMVGIEVKTAFVGKQVSRRLVRTPEGRWTVVQSAGQSWGLEYILTEGVGDKGGVLRDAVRLCQSEGLTERICLIYAYGEGAPSVPGTFAGRLSALGENTPIAFSARMFFEDQALFQVGGGFVQAFVCWIRPNAPGNQARATGSKP